MIVVPDAGPLIYLAGAGQLDLLRRLYVEVVVPRIVFEAVTITGADLPRCPRSRRTAEAVTFMRPT